MNLRSFIVMSTIIALIAAAVFVTGSTAQATCEGTYTVRTGDTLSEIATRCNVSLFALLRANPGITDPNLIFVGQEIALPGAEIPDTGDGDGDVYIVARGDTLFEIAQTYNTTVNRLLELNPSIENPALIFPGQRINVGSDGIPDTGGATVQIAPTSGPEGTVLTVTGAGFPESSTVRVGPGVIESEPVHMQDVTTTANGTFTTQVTIPADADPGETWRVLAMTPDGSISTLSQNFTVTQSGGGTGGGGEFTYIVRPGDTFSEIAVLFDTTIQALLDANPEISNPDLIFVNQRIRISE